MSIHPPEFADTDPRALEVWLDVQRRMSPADKIEVALDAGALLLSV